MDSLLRYNVYFENIARMLNSIAHSDTDKHFVNIHSEALFSELQYAVKDRAFFLEHYSAGMNNNQGTLTKKPSGAFSIMKFVPSSGSFEDKTAAIAWAEAECTKVLAKINNDVRNGVADVRSFDFGSVEFLPLDNRPVGWCGMRVSFDFDVASKLCFDENEWLSDAALVSVCKPLEEYTAAELLLNLSGVQLSGIMDEQNVLLLEDGDLIEIE